MPPRPRSYDPVKVRAALSAEVGSVREALRVMCAAPDAAELLEAPAAVGPWTVRQLAERLTGCLETAARLVQGVTVRGRAEVGVLDSVRHLLSVEGSAPAPAGGHAPGPPDAVLRAFDAAAEKFGVAAAVDTAKVVPAGAGAMTVADLLTVLVLELVVRGDDLTLATGTAVAHDRQALAVAVRLTADALAAAAPGGSVEVRIPPFAVIQCVEGPRHTRGTPPNVVEAPPLVWIRLVSGRRSWREALAAGQVSASGERADLAGLLPLCP
ncbi:sterol carrier family protein [Streptomyces meridianus]|uniref:Sterol carrier family protein n=1 Tax=Streptomyces meridianus TaxID=2938945 RepID=A0ABT0XCQ7_9ACTN|nr:sterol carrier family protein [Streptomyces meridianus]MCM2580296.1 sterol carrier family protein [Streptomyces meridianus]